MNSTGIIAYTFAADLYCEECIVEAVVSNTHAGKYAYGSIEDKLDKIAIERDVDRHDEQTFDSGDFPKVVFTDQVTEEDICCNCEFLITANV